MNNPDYLYWAWRYTQCSNYGQNDFIEELQINGDGSIFIKDIGEVVLLPKTFEASQIIIES